MSLSISGHRSRFRPALRQLSPATHSHSTTTSFLLRLLTSSTFSVTTKQPVTSVVAARSVTAEVADCSHGDSSGGGFLRQPCTRAPLRETCLLFVLVQIDGNFSTRFDDANRAPRRRRPEFDGTHDILLFG
ncbi:uncharacterized protein LOC118490621 isoform X2 [Helianthus annuus]|uniref:uncharacterized protein LOC118490621 isoform X2 n=1 Tax=Helianthus annuus TaxID=4232 RepID=UPI001652F4E0|nr:uncharacterized protein LOC118490621 isoform X2 [Helianthus annuus]